MITAKQAKYLAGVVRTEIRRWEKSVETASPYPGQPPEAFEAFRNHLVAGLEFRREVLGVLDQYEETEVVSDGT